MKNESGIRPIEFNCVIAQDAISERTAGGLMKPQESLDRERFAQTKGTLIAASPMAFTYDEWPDGAQPPRPGARVIFARHSGVFVEGTDGKEYRVVKDKDIVAVMEGDN